MPTVEITSPPLTASTRLRASLRITRWLADRGSHTTHVVVLFRAADPMTYFVGGIPMSRYGDEAGERESKRARWASVVCQIHPDRDHSYMSSLAQEVKEALRLAGDSSHFLVRFEPTQPDRIFYLESRTLASSIPTLSGNTTTEGH